MTTLLVVLAAALGVLVWRLLRRGRRGRAVVVVIAIRWIAPARTHAAPAAI